METIGQRLKAARESTGLDQTQFATEIGSSRNTISLWERGKNFPPADVLGVIHNKFGISVEWIVTGKGSVKAHSEDGIFFIELSERATHHEIMRVMAFIATVSAENADWTVVSKEHRMELYRLLFMLFVNYSIPELKAVNLLIGEWLTFQPFNDDDSAAT